MVRRQAYEQAGGHSAIKMHPIDGLMLGKIIKEDGLRQECLSGYDFVTLSWYHSTGAMIDCLMKNIFALANFNTLCHWLGAMGISLLTILPPWGDLLSHGPARLFFSPHRGPASHLFQPSGPPWMSLRLAGAGGPGHSL